MAENFSLLEKQSQNQLSENMHWLNESANIFVLGYMAQVREVLNY